MREPLDHPYPLHPPGRRAPVAVKRLGLALALVVVALVLVGQGIFLVRALGSERLDYGSSIPMHGTLTQRVSRILAAALGPSDRGVRRFRITSVSTEPGHPSLRAVRITWAINNDLAAGSIGNGAQQDVYTVLRDLYTAYLPLGQVWLTGTFPMRTRRRTQESVVMRLSMDRSTADTIGRVGWDTMDPQTVWPLVTRNYVAPELQPIAGG